MILTLEDVDSDRAECAVNGCEAPAEDMWHVCWEHLKVFGELPPNTMTAEVDDA